VGLVACVLSGVAAAQPCIEAALPQTAGIWRDAMTGSSAGLPAKDMAVHGRVFAELREMFTRSYAPLGVTVSHGGMQRSRASDTRPDSYGYSLYFLPFYCQGAQTKTETHTATVMNVWVNEADFVFSKSATERYSLDEAERSHYGWLKKMPDASGGVLHFQLEPGSNLGKDAKDDKWLVTYEGKLPFRYVSRKEYLEDAARLLTRLKEREVRNVQREYGANPQQRDKILASVVRHIDDQLATIEQVAKATAAADLMQPAIVSSFEDFRGFLREGERGAVILIKDHPGYYDRALASSVPQLFAVHFRAVTGRPVHAKAYADALAAVDFALLKSMLGRVPGGSR
jgi:hypothetical protein